VAALVVATLVEFGVGWPFLREAARRARRLTANMDTLIAVGTLAAYGFSVWELATGGMQVYFETAILLIAFLSLGRYFGRAPGAAPGRRSARCWSWAPSRPGWSATTAR
jgi:cation-transporting ATPase V/Cu+-exporting ATPase